MLDALSAGFGLVRLVEKRSVARVSGHGQKKYVTGTRLGTSEGLGWKGLLAERWSHSEGDCGDVEPRETEVVVMTRGRGRVRRRGDGRVQTHDAVPGTVWLCPAGIPEDMIRVYGDVRETMHMYLPTSSLAATLLQESDVDFDKVSLHYVAGFHDSLIEQIARSICSEMTAPGPAGSILAETLASALGVHIVRNHSNLDSGSVSLPKARGALDSRRLRRTRDFIEAHLGEALRIETLAKTVHLSPYHFSRAFKAATGLTPHRHITYRRVEKAKEMLSQRRMTLAQIAHRCGYSSQAHFTRCFKRIIGVTPGVYRTNCR